MAGQEYSSKLHSRRELSRRKYWEVAWGLMVWKPVVVAAGAASQDYYTWSSLRYCSLPG
jgi:hypothetical protein